MPEGCGAKVQGKAGQRQGGAGAVKLGAVLAAGRKVFPPADPGTQLTTPRPETCAVSACKSSSGSRVCSPAPPPRQLRGPAPRPLPSPPENPGPQPPYSHPSAAAALPGGGGRLAVECEAGSRAAEKFRGCTPPSAEPSPRRDQPRLQPQLQHPAEPGARAPPPACLPARATHSGRSCALPRATGTSHAPHVPAWQCLPLLPPPSRGC